MNESCCKILDFCPIFNVRHQIHPRDASGPKHNEFVRIDRKKTLRVIHVKPESENLPRVSYEHEKNKRKSNNRHSITEEYWFTRWNKPLKGGNCNCSFRRSQRYSKNSFINKSFSSNDVRISNYDLPATKIVDVETFVERLIQDTYFEALQEYLVKVKNIGIDNLAFQTLDELDGVMLRRKFDSPAVLEVECITQNQQEKEKHKKCDVHKSNLKKKPIVILLHGIGSTADVWWNIINKLQKAGFEIIAPDMLGHGYSAAPNQIGAYKFKNLLRYTLEVFDKYISNEGKAIVIGHSFGSSLATALARYRMQQVVQLVLISGGGPTPLAAPTEVSDTYWDCAMLIKPFVFCGLKRSFFYSSRGKHFKPCEITHGIPAYVLSYIEKGQCWPEGDGAFHRRILIPTLLVHGLQDTNVTLVQECEMERTIPRAFLELIPNAGHMSMLETPEHLSHMIICFLDWWSR
nr:protein ABHD8-like [Onthophagus taurus]